MKEVILQVIEAARGRLLKSLFSPFRPKELCFKQVRYRGSRFLVLGNEDIGWRLISKRKFEQAELSCLEKFIRNDDVCLDIGGNIGIYSVFMAKKAIKGRVVAFEPVPLNRCVLSLNLILNKLENVEIRDCVLTDCSGVVNFSVANDGAYSSIVPTGRKNQAGKLNVVASTLDELFADKATRVDIVKIDVEGAELLVLKGGVRLLSDSNLRPRVVLIELSSENFEKYSYKVEDLVRFMTSLGYRFASIGESPRKYFKQHQRTASGLFQI